MERRPASQHKKRYICNSRKTHFFSKTVDVLKLHTQQTWKWYIASQSTTGADQLKSITQPQHFLKMLFMPISSNAEQVYSLPLYFEKKCCKCVKLEKLVALCLKASALHFACQIKTQFMNVFTYSKSEERGLLLQAIHGQNKTVGPEQSMSVVHQFTSGY